MVAGDDDRHVVVAAVSRLPIVPQTDPLVLARVSARSPMRSSIASSRRSTGPSV
jgi:hypothetical protein